MTKRTISAFLLALVALSSLTAACGGEAADPPAGSQAGGAGSCGAEPPAPGAPCEAGLACAWGEESGLCEGGVWFVGRTLSAKPLPADAACNPVGRWALTYGEPETSTGHSCSELRIGEVEVRAAPSGGLLINGGWDSASLSPDGCSIEAKSSASYKNPSENWSSTLVIELKLSGDQGEGGYKHSNGGFCNGSETGKLTAARLP